MRLFLLSVPTSTHFVSLILFRSREVKVSNVVARRIMALMSNVQPDRNLPVVFLPFETMNEMSSVIDSFLPVAFSVSGPLPLNAGVDHLCHQLNKRSAASNISMSPRRSQKTALYPPLLAYFSGLR